MWAQLGCRGCVRSMHMNAQRTARCCTVVAGGSSSSDSSVLTATGGLAWLPVPNHTAAAVPVVYHPAYSAPQLPPGHRFPMGVFRSIYEMLVEEGLATAAAVGKEGGAGGGVGRGGRQTHVPLALPPREALCTVHDEEYIDAFSSGMLDDASMRRIGFGDVTRHPVLVERTKAEVAGTVLTSLLALEHGLAVNTAGGTHHAFPSNGSGYCILNDIGVAARLLLAAGRVSRIMVLDLDVHQGDGTAYMFQDDPSVYTVSFHAASNFPARKQSSDLDVALPDGMDDDAYLSQLADVLPGLLSSVRPDLLIYDAGVDVHVDDALGRLSITDDGLHRRELQVLDTCLGMGVPVAGLVGGGYAEDLRLLADRHCWLHRAANQMWRDHQL